MRLIGWTAAAVSVLAMAALALPALGSADKAYAPKNCTKPRVEPRTIYIACGDGNFYVRVKKWSFFNGREAGGRGKAFANDCVPDCAEGSFHKYRVKIHLTKVRKKICGGRRVPMFQKIELRFKHRTPSGLGRHEKFDLYCVP